MAVRIPTESIARRTPKPTPSKATKSTLAAIEVLRGHQARVAAFVQAGIWGGLSRTERIIDRAETAELIDARGDREQQALLTNLTRIARRALDRREYATHAELQAEIARVRLVIELDRHEDEHRLAMADHAIEANGSLRRANGGIGHLLGQQEALCEMETLHPLTAACSIGGER